jgi:hypothetical protein
MNPMSNEERLAHYLEHRDEPPVPMSEAQRTAADALLTQLSDETLWAEPPADLADLVVRRIQSERSAEQQMRTRSLSRRGVQALAACAAAVALVLSAVAVLSLNHDDDTQQQYALNGTPLAPDARGSVVTRETGSGLGISLRVDGLAAAQPGTFYQAWVKGDAGAVPIGTFHIREGEDTDVIELWSGVDPKLYPTMTVTLQREGAGPASSGQVVLQGKVVNP